MRDGGGRKRLVVQLPPADPREARLRRGGGERRRPRAALARAIAGVDFDAGADADEEFQAASALARAALLELSDETVREYLVRERSFSAAWREAAAFVQTTIVATPG